VVSIVENAGRVMAKLKIRPEPFTAGTDKKSHMQWFYFKWAPATGHFSLQPQRILHGSFSLYAYCVSYLQPTCSLHAAYMQPSCSLHATYLQPTCNLPAAYMRPTCSLHATNMQPTCSRNIHFVSFPIRIRFLPLVASPSPQHTRVHDV